MKVIILTKESEAKQEFSEVRTKCIADYVKNKNLVVWKTYKITKSPIKSNQKQFQELIRDIEQSKETVSLIVDTIDGGALQRSFKKLIILDDLIKAGKLEIHICRENLIIHQKSNYTERMRWDMGIGIARCYLSQLSNNVKRALEWKRRNRKS